MCLLLSSVAEYKLHTAGDRNLTTLESQSIHNKGLSWTQNQSKTCWFQEELTADELPPSFHGGQSCTEAIRCNATPEEGEILLPKVQKMVLLNKENVSPLLPVDNSILRREFSEDAFVALLKSCSIQKDLHRGSKVHASIVKAGFTAQDHSICTTLINMYAKCGEHTRAQSTFNERQVQDIRSWNALIAGYVQHRHAEQALKCFDQMEQVGILPDAISFSCILKACGTLALADRGQKLHSRVVNEGLLEKNIVVANSVLDMYIKCGLLKEAEEVFDKLPYRDVISWNTIIAGLVQGAQADKALIYFETMQSCGITPNVVTFLYILKACGNIGAITKAEEIRSKIMEEGSLQNGVILGTALVGMYANCGLFQKAEDVLCKLPVHNVTSWNALIFGYVQHSHHEDALRCFDQMQLEGFSPTAATYTCILKACSSLGAADKGRFIHAEIANKASFMSNLAVVNALVDMYAKCGLLDKAQEVFGEIPVRDAISWNALIAGYAQHGPGEIVMRSFEQMQTAGFFPDAITYVCMLKACGCAGVADAGQELHARVVKEGFLDDNNILANSLVDMYSKCGLLAEAQAVFDNISIRDVISWSALICGYADHMYSQEALDRFEQMQYEGFFPNSVTFLCILKACCSIGSAKKGQELHAEIVKQGLMEKNMTVGSALVDLYANCGMLAEAQGVFDRLPVRDTVVWNAFIAGLTLLGEHETVLDSYNRMVEEGVEPDLVTCTILLNTCSHRGLLEEAYVYFQSLSAVKDISPTLEHHTCIIDLFGRAGHLEEAIVIVRDMYCVADPIVWHTIVSACHKWGNLQLGRLALSHIAQLDDGHDGTAYVCVSNIFAACMYV